jgi:hypothetical protein
VHNGYDGYRAHFHQNRSHKAKIAQLQRHAGAYEARIGFLKAQVQAQQDQFADCQRRVAEAFEAMAVDPITSLPSRLPSSAALSTSSDETRVAGDDHPMTDEDVAADAGDADVAMLDPALADVHVCDAFPPVKLNVVHLWR